MTFLTILIVLFVFRNWHGANPVRDRLDLQAYMVWAAGKAQGNWQYALAVGVPVLVVFVVSAEVANWLQGLVWLLFSVALLIYCLDFSDLDSDIEEQTSRLAAVTADDDFADVVQSQEDFQHDHLYAMFQGVVPAIFWFLMVGPAGALAYFLTQQYLDGLDDDDPQIELLDQIIYWLEWVPLRITGLLFSFAGNFGPTFDYWLNQILDTEEPTASHLVTMAGLAVDTPDQHGDDVLSFAQFASVHVQNMKYLCERALFGWLGVAALAAILSG